MNQFKIIGVSHKTAPIEEVGKFHIDDSSVEKRLNQLKNAMNLSELCYLSTCNRVEFLIVCENEVDTTFIQNFARAFNPSWSETEVTNAAQLLQVISGEKAVEHMFCVASSIDSMVIGEREIITQFRNAYEKCNGLGLTGDMLRIISRQTIETAKEVYTTTNIATKPVSVVALAYRKLQSLNISLDARILVVGSGKTNTTMVRFLKKHGFTNFTIYNRTLAHALGLAKETLGSAYVLNELQNHKKGFDVLLTCTGSANQVITSELFEKLNKGESSRKVVIDLAMPNDFNTEICKSYPVELISIAELNKISSINLKARKKEIGKCYKVINHHLIEYKKIFKQRQVELAMRSIPGAVHDIRNKAVDCVFAKDIEVLDDNAKEVLDKILCYMEKKYISVPIKMAKEIILEKDDLK